MKVWRRICGSAILAGILALALVTPAFAGGWAVVTLDAVPRSPSAGQALSLGFMVRQHGVTPIDTAFDGPIMKPILTARNAATGETLRADARKEGPVGHFVVDVTFPSVGTWAWQIAPEPFGATDLGTLSVSPVGAANTQPSTTLTARNAAALNPALVRDGLRWLGVALLLLAVGIGLWGQRVALTRRGAAAR